VSLISAGFIILLAHQSFAQTPSAGTGVADGGTREVLVSIFIPSLPGAPFVATVNTEWIRPLADGTRITLKNHRLIARDKSGRIFQERRLLVPEDDKQQSVITQTEITDPLAQEEYICRPSEHVCQLEVFHPIAAVVAGGRSGTEKKPGTPEEESLGIKWIAGVETSGTRETTIIPPGTIGNNNPLRFKREYWYSLQLGLNMLSIREDPRFGTQRFELSDVVPGDPDPKLFAPPEGSKILDLRTPTVIEPPATPQ
jgi:hypothetical protein